MILRVPDYYQEFQCIGSRCKDNCCIGWEIDIDEDTYEYYSHMDGELGKRLKQHLKGGDVNHFELIHKRCPFLNNENLCDICIQAGEEALCEVCTEYPRFTVEYGKIREKMLALSCEEASRLLFTHKEPLLFVETEIKEQWNSSIEDECMVIINQQIEAENPQPEYEAENPQPECKAENPQPEYKAENLQPEYEDNDQSLQQYIRQARDFSITLLQNRTQRISHRILCFLQYAKQVQDCLNHQEAKKIVNVTRFFQSSFNSAVSLSPDSINANAHVAGCQDGGAFSHVEDHQDEGAFSQIEDHQDAFSYEADSMKAHKYFRKRINVLQKMEVLDEEWRKCMKDLHSYYYESSKAKDYEQGINQLNRYLADREEEYEQLLVYFVFRYVIRSVYDYNFLDKAKFCVFCTLVIRDMDLLRMQQNGNQYTIEDRIDIARIFSKEVEHSEDNLEYLADAMLFESVCDVECLCRQVMLSFYEQKKQLKNDVDIHAAS